MTPKKLLGSRSGVNPLARFLRVSGLLSGLTRSVRLVLSGPGPPSPGTVGNNLECRSVIISDISAVSTVLEKEIHGVRDRSSQNQPKRQEVAMRCASGMGGTYSGGNKDSRKVGAGRPIPR